MRVEHSVAVYTRHDNRPCDFKVLLDCDVTNYACLPIAIPVISLFFPIVGFESLGEEKENTFLEKKFKGER